MSTTPARRFDTDLPDAKGYFGPYGGQLVPPVLKQAMDDIDVSEGYRHHPKLHAPVAV